MRHFLPMFIARYWIVVAVLFFALLSTYTSSTMYGQSAPPTPDVNTVPPIELLQTPTNTPFPTPTPEDDDSQSGGGNVFEPTPTPFLNTDNNGNGDNENRDNESDNNGGSSGGGATGGGGINNGTSNDTVGSGGSDTGSGTETQAMPAASTVGYPGTVNVVTLNVRRAPSTDAPIVDTVFVNDQVTVLSRDSSNTWWYICCGSGAGREGWVSAQFITPSFALDDAESLLPISATTKAATDDSAAADALVLEMRPNPAFVWQGQTVRLQYTVHNLSDQTLTKVRLRNDLPPTLSYLGTDAGQQGVVQKTGDAKDGIIYTINWPTINAGATLTATVTLQLANDIPNGALVDNLAVVESAEGANALAGITFAMPPQRLPLFR